MDVELKKKKKRVFWSVTDRETLTAETVADAVAQWVEEDASAEESEWPEEVEVVEYVPKAVELSGVLDTVLESLDEEYSNPDAEAISAPTSRMREAEQAFIQVIKEEYEPWACVPSGRRVMVPVRGFLYVEDRVKELAQVIERIDFLRRTLALLEDRQTVLVEIIQTEQVHSVAAP